MKRRFIGITLLLVFVSLWTILVADAGTDEHLDVAEQGVENTKTIADEDMLDALIASFLYSHANSEYVKNQAKINNGGVVMASSLLGLAVQTVPIREKPRFAADLKKSAETRRNTQKYAEIRKQKHPYQIPHKRTAFTQQSTKYLHTHK